MILHCVMLDTFHLRWYKTGGSSTELAHRLCKCMGDSFRSKWKGMAVIIHPSLDAFCSLYSRRITQSLNISKLKLASSVSLLFLWLESLRKLFDGRVVGFTAEWTSSPGRPIAKLSNRLYTVLLAPIHLFRRVGLKQKEEWKKMTKFSPLLLRCSSSSFAFTDSSGCWIKAKLF